MSQRSRPGEHRLRHPRQLSNGGGNGSIRVTVAAPIRRALEHAIKQKDHTLRIRFEASCDIAPRDVEPLSEAARPLYWAAIDRAQDIIARDDRPEAQAFVEWVNSGSDEVQRWMASLVDLIGAGAFMEGWIAGNIYAFEKAESVTRARHNRPGR